MPVKDAFLAGILAHVPEAERGKAETALIALEEGHLRQSDYSKLADEAKQTKERFDALYQSNTEWFEANKAALDEATALRAKVTELEKRPAPAADLPKDVVTKKDLDTILSETERGAVGFIAEAQALALKHYQDFGEVLNITDLLADKRVQQIGLRGVYADKFKPQIEAKAKAAADARDEEIRKAERAKVEQEFASRKHPYPVVGNEPSALDGIEAARAGEKPAVKTVDDMAAEYARLSGARAGAA